LKGKIEFANNYFNQNLNSGNQMDLSLANRINLCCQILIMFYYIRSINVVFLNLKINTTMSSFYKIIILLQLHIKYDNSRIIVGD
jgi:hypothetical protein